MIIPLPWPKPPLTGNRTRGNPYARANEVKAAKEAAVLAVQQADTRPIVGANVALHFRPATRQRRDADGLFPTLKVCQDALVECGVLPDDSWVSVPAATCRIVPPIKGEPGEMWLALDVLTEWDPCQHIVGASGWTVTYCNAPATTTRTDDGLTFPVCAEHGGAS